MTVLFTDNANRANGGIGANWSDIGGAMTIVSNEFAYPAGLALTYWNGGSPTTQCYVRWRATVKPAPSNTAGMAINLNGSTNGYGFLADTSGAGFITITGGGAAALGAGITAPTDGTDLILARNGTGFAIYYNRAQQATRTDSTYTDGGLTAFYGLGTTARADNVIIGSLIAVLSSPVVTLPSPLGAAIAVTTDEDWGNYYVVVDTAANLAGVTNTQVAAGQKAAGTAALASANAAVTTTSPSASVTGLQPGTLYSYALTQNLFGVLSTLQTGTFRTPDFMRKQSRKRRGVRIIP